MHTMNRETNYERAIITLKPANKCMNGRIGSEDNIHVRCGF